jgi:hypothetical protein
VTTPLDGTGILAAREAPVPVGVGYKAGPVPPVEQVSTVDDVLFGTATEITRIAPPRAPAIPPEAP